MADEPEVPEFYVDQFLISTNQFGAAITFGLSPAHPSPGKLEKPTERVRLRMSLEHVKVMAMLVKQHLKNYEANADVQIQVPYEVIKQLGLADEQW